MVDSSKRAGSVFAHWQVSNAIRRKPAPRVARRQPQASALALSQSQVLVLALVFSRGFQETGRRGRPLSAFFKRPLPAPATHLPAHQATYAAPGFSLDNCSVDIPIL